jgi:hypothetical protein
MWTCIERPAFIILFATTSLLAPQRVGAEDDDDLPDWNQETSRIEQEFTENVGMYNQLLKQNRFDEAIVLGKQAQLLQPQNPISEIMLLKAKLSKQDVFNKLWTRLNATVVADVSEVPASSNILEEVHRISFWKGGEFANSRHLLDAALERRIERVDLICQLAEKQKQKLQLAGRGDIKRFFDRVETLWPKVQRTHEVHNDGLLHLELCGTFGAGSNQPARGLGLFDQGSLFSKTLKRSLTKGQTTAFESSSFCRQAATE